MGKVTAEQCVRALKTHGLSSSAKVISQFVDADSRAVATAMRQPVRDGRVTITWKRGIAFYRFKRLKPTDQLKGNV